MKKVLSFIFITLIVSLCIPTISYAAQSVPVTVPSFDVTLNGMSIDSLDREYPLIIYKDITYFPMTYYDCRFLGLETAWDGQSGLAINNTGLSGAFQEQKSAIANSRNAFATICDFPVMVNGYSIDNATEEYPLLVFRDVTYFPLTWRFAVEEFGWEYSFTESEGLSIRSASQPVPISSVGSTQLISGRAARDPVAGALRGYGNNRVSEIQYSTRYLYEQLRLPLFIFTNVDDTIEVIRTSDDQLAEAAVRYMWAFAVGEVIVDDLAEQLGSFVVDDADALGDLLVEKAAEYSLGDEHIVSVTIEAVNNETAAMIVKMSETGWGWLSTYIGITYNKDTGLRYFTLEKSFENLGYMFCEIGLGGHQTYGAIENSKAAFMKSINTITTKE